MAPSANARMIDPAPAPPGARLKLTAPTRPDRDSLLRFLTGVDAELSGGWTGSALAQALSRLRRAAHGRVAVACEDGALLQWLDAWENTLLPVYFDPRGEDEVARWRARGVIAALAGAPDAFDGRSVGELTLFETRLAGFVKAMLVEPELLVLDCLFERLGYDEQRRARGFIELFERRYPMRSMLYVGLTDADPGFLPGFVPLDAIEENRP